MAIEERQIDSVELPVAIRSATGSELRSETSDVKVAISVANAAASAIAVE